MRKPRHIPIRTCVACRETDEKRDLLRIVRLPDGSVQYDSKGKISGRGAYVCARAECIALARKQKKLERSLKVSGVPDTLYMELTARAVAAQDSPVPSDLSSPSERAGDDSATAPPAIERATPPRTKERA